MTRSGERIKRTAGAPSVVVRCMVAFGAMDGNGRGG